MIYIYMIYMYNIYICICICTCICICICISICISVCIYVCIYIYIYMYMYVYIYNYHTYNMFIRNKHDFNKLDQDVIALINKRCSMSCIGAVCYPKQDGI